MALRPAYFAREAATNLRRNLLMALASILATAISLVLLGSVLMLYRVVKNVTAQWENDVVIIAFIRDDANTAQVTSLRETITGYKEVKAVRYVSKKDAYNEFRDMFSNNPDLLESVDTDTLPASFRVSLDDTNTLDSVQARIEKLAGIEEVNSAKETVQKVQTVLSVISLIVLGAAVVLLGAAIVLISNTIRLAIFARRKEIAIMKLVGATNWFIRWPFMLEGLVQGLIGAVVAFGLILFIRFTIIGWVSDQVAFLPFGIPNSWMVLIGGLVAVVGALIAVGGTAFALRKYLEV
jgi:cell division transport system permease protein